MRRRLVMTLALLLLAGSQAPAQAPTVYRLAVTGVVENGLAPYVARGLREAAAAGAAAVYLDIDTPGGRIDAAERIADAVGASTVPVYAFVNPRAYSAGALIALSAKAIYMRPGAVLGAATPVDGQGVKASEKMVSAMRGEFRALAEARGLDPRVAEAMVDERVEVPGLDTPDELLTLSTNEALRVRLRQGGRGRRARAAPRDRPAGRTRRDARAELGGAGRPVPHQPARLAAAAVARHPRPRVRDQDRRVRARRADQPGVARALLRLELPRRASRDGRRSSCWASAWWRSAIEVFVLPGFGAAGILGIVALGAAVIAGHDRHVTDRRPT